MQVLADEQFADLVQPLGDPLQADAVGAHQQQPQVFFAGAGAAVGVADGDLDAFDQGVEQGMAPLRAEAFQRLAQVAKAYAKHGEGRRAMAGDQLELPVQQGLEGVDADQRQTAEVLVEIALQPLPCREQAGLRQLQVMDLPHQQVIRRVLLAAVQAAGLDIGIDEERRAGLAAVVFQRPVVVGADVPQPGQAVGAQQHAVLEVLGLGADMAAGEAVQGRFADDLQRGAFDAHIHVVQVAAAATATEANAVRQAVAVQQVALHQALHQGVAVEQVIAQRIDQRVVVQRRRLRCPQRFQIAGGAQPEVGEQLRFRALRCPSAIEHGEALAPLLPGLYRLLGQRAVGQGLGERVFAGAEDQVKGVGTMAPELLCPVGVLFGAAGEHQNVGRLLGEQQGEAFETDDGSGNCEVAGA